MSIIQDSGMELRQPVVHPVRNREVTCCCGLWAEAGAAIDAGVLDVGLAQMMPDTSGKVPLGGEHFLIVILLIHHQRLPHLRQVTVATGLAGGFPCLSEYREEDCGQNCDDGDDNKQLDQGETAVTSHARSPL